MILNGVTVLASFAAVLRVAAAGILLAIGLRAWREWRRAGGVGLDPRYHLLAALSMTLLALALVSWPLFYLVLQSYVPRFPGVMCMEGVTRIGERSIGPAAWLPRLAAGLQISKPALLFLTGAWLVLHFANRRDRTGAFTGRVLAAMLVAGMVATLDGVAEASYLLIPKQERRLARGCCTQEADPAADSGAGEIPSAPPSEPRETHPGLTIAFFAAGSVALAALEGAARSKGTTHARWLGVALAGTIPGLMVAVPFLRNVASPAFLRLPYHHCAYCLLASAPESLFGAALYVGGAFGTGWACVAAWLGNSRGSAVPPPPSARLSRFAQLGYGGALLMAGTRLVLP